MALKQLLTQKLEQRLSPQQIQLMKLLQIPTIELEQRIKQEIEENPALEEGSDVFDLDSENEENNDEFENDDTSDKEEIEFDLSDYLDDDPDYTYQHENKQEQEEKYIPLSGEQSFQEKLMEQLHLLDLDDQQFMIADTIIGNIDESGYLSRSIDALVDDLAFSLNVYTSEQEVVEILSLIQDLDPAGVAARNLQECLLIQLNRKQDGDITKYTAKIILEQCFEEFTKKHYDKILKKLEIEEEDLKEAIDEILKLNPKPGGTSKDDAKDYQQIIPDFTVNETDGKLELTINSKNAPELKVSKEYENMLRAYSEGAKNSKSAKDALFFVKQKLDNAKWFIDAIKQREQTMLLTMNAILTFQTKFFLTGDETNLKPMILKDIATLVGLDISTVSRVANSKYVQTNLGVYPLKYFFSEALTTESGEEVSSREVKRILTDAILNEDKHDPLTDEKLMALLNEKGYHIARRTVAKYREQLNFPVARMRKEL